MTRLTTHVSAITLTVIDLTAYAPPERNYRRFDARHMVAAAVLSHVVRHDGRLKFSLEARAIPAGTGEVELADWLEDVMTMQGLLTGYHLHDVTVPLLLSCTERGRHPSLAELADINADQFCDLTERNWNGGVVPFEAACARASIDIQPADDRLQQSWWATTMIAHLEAVVSAQAVAAWRLWLHGHAARAGSPRTCRDAEADLAAWLENNPRPATDTIGRLLPQL